MSYKPQTPFNVPMILLRPEYAEVSGVVTKTYAEAGLIFGSFKSYGGTEREVNGLYSIEDTAIVETWYRPDIKADCRLDINGKQYDILNEPENIDLRNQWLKFKVIAVRGGA